MAALTTQNLVAAGTAPTYVTPGTADTAEVGNGINMFLHYKNTNASSRTVTLKMDHRTLDTGATFPDKTFTLAGTNGELWIPLRKEYEDSVGAGIGRCDIQIDTTPGVSVAAIRHG